MNLHHYTNVDALQSIVTSNKLWLSHIRYMNDEGELIRAFDYVEDILSQKFADNYVQKHRRLRKNVDGSYNEFHAEAKKLLNNWANSIDIFVGSFCQKSNDLLSQWRGYSNGTTGYCISFDSEKILESISKYNEQGKGCLSGELVECVYKDSEIVDQIDSIKHKLTNGNYGFANEGIVEAISLCAKSKHEGFQEECEKRLLVQTNDNAKENVQYRSSNGILIPYLEIDISVDAIKSIKVGPSNNQELAGRSLRSYLDKIGKNKVEIEYSETPLRN